MAKTPKVIKVEVDVESLERSFQTYVRMTGQAFSHLIETMAELSEFYREQHKIEYDWDELLSAALNDLEQYYSTSEQ